MAERNTPTVDDLISPLLAAVGAADLALERVNEIVSALRERAGEAWLAIERAGRPFGISCVGHEAASRYALLERTSPAALALG